MARRSRSESKADEEGRGGERSEGEDGSLENSVQRGEAVGSGARRGKSEQDGEGERGDRIRDTLEDKD